MKKYTEICTDNYCIEELKCQCKICCHNFMEYIPTNYELVCFVDDLGKKFFLPTYGTNGYSELEKKLVNSSNHNPKENINEFMKKLNLLTPNNLSYINDYRKLCCPKCQSNSIFIYESNTLLNHPVNWVKIDLESIK